MLFRSGLGVVAFDQAAAAQHVEDGHNGMLASADDERTFIDAAGWLLENGENLRRVRLNARQHAARQGWSSIVEQFEQHLYTAQLDSSVPKAGRKPTLAIESKRAN